MGDRFIFVESSNDAKWKISPAEKEAELNRTIAGSLPLTRPLAIRKQETHTESQFSGQVLLFSQ